MIKNTHRVVATGIGILSPNGIGKNAFWKAILMGISGIKLATFVDVSNLPSKVAGEITDFDPLDYLNFKLVKRTGRVVHLAVAATQLALQDAGIDKSKLDKENTELVIGIGCPSMDSIGTNYETYIRSGPDRISPYTTFTGSIHMSATAICNELGLQSSAMTLSTNCTAGLDAIGYASQIIRNGAAKTVIAGGLDAPLDEFTFASFCKAGMLTKFDGPPEKASRPFDKIRDGGVLSEGATAIILEELEHALKKRRTIYGEIRGFGNVGEFSNGPESNGAEMYEGMALAIKKALGDANILPEEIEYISAHAPSDPLIDKIETNAIKTVFGSYAYKIPISSIKSMIGNPIAAAASMQAASGLLSLSSQQIPPTINYEYPDPDCDLDYVPNKMRYNNVSNILVNSRGLGGNCSALVIKKFES
jgi:3-oxoacyl-[acyl-carrier-protein] synthase II